MPRKPRHQSPTDAYHLINRGADRQDTFSREADYRHFEALLGEASEQVSVEVHAYCLMTNHFHLVVYAPGGGVSEFMHRLTGPYSQGYNRRNARSGPLFEGRYRAIPVANHEQFVALGRYVHRNPLSIVPVRALASYRWSSFGAYCDSRGAPDWLVCDRLTSAVTPERYRQFVETALPSDKRDPETWALALVPSWSELENAIAHCLGVERSTLLRSDAARANVGRTLAVMLASELRLATASEIAQRYQFASANSVRTRARRGRVQAEVDQSFQQTRARVLARIGNLSRLVPDPKRDELGVA